MKGKEMIEIVLVELKVPENIGFIARVMKNFGFNKLVLYKCRITKESYITSANAKDILENAIKIDSLEEYLNDFNLVVGTTGITSERTDRYIRSNYYTPNELPNLIKGRTAILFGREDFGLFDREIKLCNAIVSVPTDKNYPVMNVSHAAAIILYELKNYMDKIIIIEDESKNMVKTDLATQKDIEILIRYFEDLMYESWFPKHRINRMKVLLKRAFGKSGMTRYEITAISGILRKTLIYLTYLKKRYEV